MSKKKLIPNWIYCPKCGNKLNLKEITDPETLRTIKNNGYEEASRGICECGLIAVICYQPLPASPTFSLFFDIYKPEEIIKLKSMTSPILS